MANTYYDQGSAPDFNYVSLCGIKGRKGAGLVNRRALNTSDIPINPLRVAMQLRNSGTARCYFVLGATTDAITGYTLYLDPGDVLLINQDFPWVGAIHFYSVAGVSIVSNELSLAAI